MNKVLTWFTGLIVAVVRYFLKPGRSFIFYVTWFFSLSTGGAIFLATVLYLAIDLTPVENLKHYKPPIPSKMYDRKGRLITTFFKDQRIIIDIKDTPSHLAKAFIALEDNAFYEHGGVNIHAIVRAMLKNLAARAVVQGGSTITQQVAKVIFTDRARTYTRKIREALMALYMEKLYTKDQILEMYFNQIYFGHGTYGVEAASRFYFKKSSSELNIGESAILASLPSAPNYYSPVKNPLISRQRVLQALLKMVDLAFITRAQAIEEYKKLTDYYASLEISPSETAYGNRTDNAPYFTEHMRKLLLEKYGEKALYEEGLSIYTGLDLDRQKAAQKALWSKLEEQTRTNQKRKFDKYLEFGKSYNETTEAIKLLFDLPDYKTSRSFSQYEAQLYFHKHLVSDLEALNLALGGDIAIEKMIQRVRNESPYETEKLPVEGAFVEIDHMTGEITAMVGGNPFKVTNQINRTVQMKRQPGSTFKPILYTAAIDSKVITAASIFPDTPTIFLDTDGEYWIPENYSLGYRGFVSIREALRFSINMVTIAVAREAGIYNLLPAIGRQIHEDPSRIPSNLTVALGSFEVSPIQLARAFSAFPRGGKDLELVFINRILDSEGKEVYAYKPSATNNTQLFQPGTAAIMTSLLQDVISNGTGRKIRSAGYNGFAAGKTGTTNNYRDAWFVGFNKRYTSAVWVGYDKPTLSLGPGQAGGNVSAPIWASYQLMTQSLTAKEKPYFIFNGVTEAEICKSTGKIPTYECSEVVNEFFLPGTIPSEEELNHGDPNDFDSSAVNNPDAGNSNQPDGTPGNENVIDTPPPPGGDSDTDPGDYNQDLY